MFEPKIPAFGALIGFALSFLVGLVSGAAIGTVLARALLMALLSGALVLVIRLVIARFLPELQEGLSEPDAPVTGSTVDISIDGDSVDFNPYASPPGGDEGLGQPVPDFLAARPQRDASGGGNQGTVSDDTVESLEDASDENTDAETVVATGTEKPAFTGSGSSVSGSAGTKQQVNPSAHVLPKVPTGSLDSLPDMEDFQAAKPAAEYEDPEGEPSNPNLVFREGLFSAPAVEDSSVESETMAKAIRTMLSRDTQ